MTDEEKEKYRDGLIATCKVYALRQAAAETSAAAPISLLYTR